MKYTISILTLFWSSWIMAQQDVQISNQIFSQTNINPASIGTSNYGNAFLFVRQQWAGFEDAPITQVFNAYGYLLDYRSGVGLSVVNDIVGRNGYFNFKFSYAYNVQTAPNSYLAFGINVGGYNRRLNDVYTLLPEPDPSLAEEINNGKSVLRPDADIGFSFTSPKFNFGLSATHLATYAFKESWHNVPPQLHLFTSYTFGNQNKFFFIPFIQGALNIYHYNYNNFNITFYDRLSYQLSAGATFGFKNLFYAGAAYRYNNTVVGMVGVALGKSFKIGYAYDFRIDNTFSNIRNYGSHEIFINYRLLIEETIVSIDTPRFFD